jgi:glutaredoxin 3
VKEFLSQRGIEFTERNVAEDESALVELEQLGVLTTPVTLIDDEMVIGFDRQKLNALLSGEEVSDNG